MALPVYADVEVMGDVTVEGNTELNGDVKLNGNVTIGDKESDKETTLEINSNSFIGPGFESNNETIKLTNDIEYGNDIFNLNINQNGISIEKNKKSIFNFNSSSNNSTITVPNIETETIIVHQNCNATKLTTDELKINKNEITFALQDESIYALVPGDSDNNTKLIKTTKDGNITTSYLVHSKHLAPITDRSVYSYTVGYTANQTSGILDKDKAYLFMDPTNLSNKYYEVIIYGSEVAEQMNITLTDLQYTDKLKPMIVCANIRRRGSDGMDHDVVVTGCIVNQVQSKVLLQIKTNSSYGNNGSVYIRIILG